MEALLTSALVVALAEVGDKTQLLTVLLACRFARPWPIAAGILVATLANHALAALAGQELAGWFDGPLFRYAVAGGFLAMAVWTLFPDRLDEEDAPPCRRNVFLTTLVVFFLVEMGDKTQIATVALGAQFREAFAITLGTTLGMMLANAPALVLGERLLRILPLKTLRLGAALLFALLGVWILAETAGLL